MLVSNEYFTLQHYPQKLMKKSLVFLCLISLLSSCSNEEKPTEEIVIPSQSIEPVAPEDPVSAVRAYGQAILEDRIQPADNNQTSDCLDSLLSPNPETRLFFFDVYLAIADKSDGALSERVCEKALAYFEKFPNEAVIQFMALGKEDQSIFLDNLAYEFYALGGNIANDVNECIDKILAKCGECQKNENQFEQIRLEIIKRANKIKA